MGNLIGRRIKTLYQYSETGTVVRPRAENLPLPSPDWFIVKYDNGGKGCIHRSMFALAN